MTPKNLLNFSLDVFYTPKILKWELKHLDELQVDVNKDLHCSLYAWFILLFMMGGLSPVFFLILKPFFPEIK